MSKEKNYAFEDSAEKVREKSEKLVSSLQEEMEKLNLDLGKLMKKDVIIIFLTLVIVFLMVRLATKKPKKKARKEEEYRTLKAEDITPDLFRQLKDQAVLYILGLAKEKMMEALNGKKELSKKAINA